MQSTTKAEWILRIAVAGEFIGMACSRFSKKAGWIKYFEAVGYSSEQALTLMPLSE